MATRKISGDFDTNQITRAIMWKEAGGYQFVDSAPMQDSDGIQNRVTFKYFEGAKYPPDCLVQVASKPKPSGFAHEWTGLMQVEGIGRQVKLYRRSD